MTDATTPLASADGAAGAAAALHELFADARWQSPPVQSRLPGPVSVPVPLCSYAKPSDQTYFVQARYKDMKGFANVDV